MALFSENFSFFLWENYYPNGRTHERFWYEKPDKMFAEKKSLLQPF